MIKVGSRVHHQNSKESFGDGLVLEINRSKTALVRWDIPRVRRTARRAGRTPLTEQESHVDLKCLHPIPN